MVKVKSTYVRRFSVHLSVEASVVISVYWTVQEGQTVSSDIFLSELDFPVHSIYVLILTQVSSTDLIQWLGAVPVKVISALNLFHVEGDHCWGHWGAHNTAGRLSVEAFTVLK